MYEVSSISAKAQQMVAVFREIEVKSMRFQVLM